MAADESSDLIIKFVRNGKPISGQCTTNLISAEPSSPLLVGFNYNDSTGVGDYSEIDRFSMNAGVQDSGTQDQETKDRNGSGGHSDDKKKAKIEKGLSFMSWRQGNKNALDVSINDITFSRTVDKTSITLIKSCLERDPFDNISLIKRRSSGIRRTDGSVPTGEVYLRLDFYAALITGIDWSDGDRVEESCRFICRAVTISYRPQLPSGKLGAVISKYFSFGAKDTQPPLS